MSLPVTTTPIPPTTLVTGTLVDTCPPRSVSVPLTVGSTQVSLHRSHLFRKFRLFVSTTPTVGVPSLLLRNVRLPPGPLLSSGKDSSGPPSLYVRDVQDTDLTIGNKDYWKQGLVTQVPNCDDTRCRGTTVTGVVCGVTRSRLAGDCHGREPIESEDVGIT